MKEKESMSVQYPGDYEAKKLIVELGRRLYERGFVASNDGNISCKVSENEIWCTPTGVSKGYMTEDMMVKMDLDGNILKGTAKPSSEIKMHIRVYQENPEVGGVVHAHPPISTAYACAGVPLDVPILAEAVVQLGEVPLAPYAVPGTQEVPDSIAPFCRTHNAVLLENHGALAWGPDALTALHRMESVEFYATTLLNTKLIGRMAQLDREQIDVLAMRAMGTTRPGPR